MSAANRTTEYEYTLDGQLAVLTARNAETGDQITRWHYGTTLAESGVASNSLLRAKVYPESDDEGPGLNGPDAIYDRVEYRYNRQGELIEQKDQNETVHAYEYDRLGRLTHDRVTALGTGIDGAVRRISRGYDRAGRVESVTSWSDPNLGNGRAVNQVLRRYNGFGQMTAEYQSHDGTVATAATPAVLYTYADGSNRHTRRLSMTYPGGRELVFYYGDENSDDDRLGRIREIRDRISVDEQPALARYTRRGLSATMQIEYPQCGGDTPLIMTYIKQAGEPDGAAGDQYTGQDQFNRIINIRWLRGGTETHVDRIQYGFDRAGNRLWRKNVVAATNWDELYSYDGLYQLADRQRGTLNADRNAVSDPALDHEQFTFDPTGNWDRYRTLASDTETLDQTRTHNLANEITAISGSGSTVAYDRAGNMSRMPKVGDWSTSQTPTWDAWNRMVKINEGDTTVGAYAYDGLAHRTWKETLEESQWTPRHFYYSDRWQILEERIHSWPFAERTYVWGTRYADDLVSRDTFGGGGLQRLYSTHDQWHIISICDESGGAQERYAYGAFGSSQVSTGGFSSRIVSEFGWNIRFCAYTLDSETQLYYVRHRYHDNQLGRWLSRDPMDEASGSNLYAYVQNQSANTTDPSGLKKDDDISFTWVERNRKNSEVSILYRQYGPSKDCCNSIWFVQIIRLKDATVWNIDYTTTKKHAAQVPYPFYPYDNTSIGAGTMTDYPGDQAWVSLFAVEQNFESCAICLETYKILGCILWGHKFGKIDRLSDYPAGATGAEIVKMPIPPSPDFLKATAGYGFK